MYMTNKQRLAINVNRFLFDDNLFLLFEVYEQAELLLKENKFPIKEYKKWKTNQ